MNSSQFKKGEPVRREVILNTNLGKGDYTIIITPIDVLSAAHGGSDSLDLVVGAQ